MTTAFVLTGGGSLGAVQVGMLQALAERDIQPDLLVGTSCGALNAAWIAGHGTSSDSLTELAAVWTGLRRSDAFPVDARQVLRGLLGFSTAVATNRKLRQLIDSHAGIDDLAQAQVPTYFIAADLLSGRDVLISSGDLATGVLASTAIPGVLPQVEHAGGHLIDGALADHTGVAQAIDLGASVIYVLPSGAACALPRAPRSAVGVALHSLTLLIEQRLIHEVASLQAEASIKLLPPLCPLDVSAADFSHADELITRARQTSLRWIDSGGTELPHPEQFLAPHHHGPVRRAPRVVRPPMPSAVPPEKCRVSQLSAKSAWITLDDHGRPRSRNWPLTCNNTSALPVTPVSDWAGGVAHNPEVAGSNPAPATTRGSWSAAWLPRISSLEQPPASTVRDGQVLDAVQPW